MTTLSWSQLAPTLEYESEDGYCGIITLDLASVKCEMAGQKTSSYTVSATREYPHLSTNDLSLIPKTITDNGRTMELDGVTWEAQHTVNVDYQDIPDSYRAVAKYTAKASKSVVTGYVTTAEYNGELSKTLSGDTVYTAYFFRHGNQSRNEADRNAGASRSNRANRNSRTYRHGGAIRNSRAVSNDTRNR